MDYLSLWLLLMSGLLLVEGRRAPPQGSCSYSKVYSMFGADCSGINLIQIPATLNKKIEILDASVNRIRILKNNSFEGHSYLRFLYLGDNPISVIEGGTFLEVPDLEVLDLSLNAIRTLPALLPASLRKLYLSENPLVEVPLQKAVGLQFLTLADCFLDEMPKLGELPNLSEMNISGNPLRRLNVSSLATFCNLKKLILPKDLIDSQYVSSCDCALVKAWTIEHDITTVPPFNCTIDTEECEANTTEEVEAFASCQVAFERQSSPQQYLLMAGAGLGLLICVSVLTVLWTRRKRPPPPASPPAEQARQAKLLPDTVTKPRF